MHIECNLLYKALWKYRNWRSKLNMSIHSKKKSVNTISHPIILNSHSTGIFSHSSVSCWFISPRCSPVTPQCLQVKVTAGHSTLTCSYKKRRHKKPILYLQEMLVYNKRSIQSLIFGTKETLFKNGCQHNILFSALKLI